MPRSGGIFGAPCGASVHVVARGSCPCVRGNFGAQCVHGPEAAHQTGNHARRNHALARHHTQAGKVRDAARIDPLGRVLDFGDPLLDRSRSLPCTRGGESSAGARNLRRAFPRESAVKRALPRGPAHAHLRACGSARLFTQESNGAAVPELAQRHQPTAHPFAERHLHSLRQPRPSGPVASGDAGIAVEEAKDGEREEKKLRKELRLPSHQEVLLRLGPRCCRRRFASASRRRVGSREGSCDARTQRRPGVVRELWPAGTMCHSSRV